MFFSAGVVLFILLTGYPPFEEAKKNDKWFKPLARENYKKFWDLHQGCPISDDNKAKDLLQRMLSYDPKKRMTIAEIKKHPWFNDKYLEGKELIHILRNRHRAMEAKRRKDTRKLKDLQTSVPPQRNIKGLELHDIPDFPENCVEGIYDLHTTADWKDVYNSIKSVVGSLSGHAEMIFDTMTLLCSVKLQNISMGQESLIRFETQVFRSREFRKIPNENINNNEENEDSESVFVVRFKRIAGSTLDWKKVLRDVIYTKCAHVLTGLPKWAREQMKTNKYNDENDDNDDYDQLLEEEGDDIKE